MNAYKKAVYDHLANIIKQAPQLQQLAQREADEEWFHENYRIINWAANIIDSTLDDLETTLKDKFE